MTQSVSERISYFRTMLLETARIPSWHYSASFSLLESSCSWEMELKNFFLLESGALLKQIQENCSQSSDPAIPFSFTDGLNFSWMFLTMFLGLCLLPMSRKNISAASWTSEI